MFLKRTQVIKSNSTIIRITHPCWYSNRHFVVFFWNKLKLKLLLWKWFLPLSLDATSLWYPIFIVTKVFVKCGIYGIYRRDLGSCWRKSVCVAELQNQCRSIWPNTNRSVFVKYILRENKYKLQVKGCHNLLKEIGLCEECGWVALSVREPSPLKYCQLLHWSCYTSWYLCQC